MPPAQVNATITRVNGAGGTDAAEGPPAAGPEKWAAPAGEQANAYYREVKQRSRTSEGDERFVERTLRVQSDEWPEWEQGDVVAFTFRGLEQTGTVRLIDRAALDGIPAELQTTRLTLEDA